MADAGELNFLLRMRDEASAALKSFGATVQSAAGAHHAAASAAKEHEQGLQGLVSKAKEAAEAIGAVWAASELSEKTIGAYAEVEVAMTRLSQASGITGDALDELQEKLAGIAGNSLTATVEQMDGVATAAARLGASGEQIETFAKTVGMLSTVTGVSVQQVQSGMEQILEATGEGVEGAHKFGEVFAYLSDKTRDGGQGLLQAAQALNMMTAGMGLSSTKTLELASAVENLGVRSRSGAMAVGQALQQLNKLATDDKMRDQLVALSAATGMTTERLKDLIQTDPSAALVAFEGALKGVIASGGDVNAFLKEFGLQGRMVQTTLVAMARHVDEVKQKMAEADKAAGGHGMEDKNDKYMQTLSAATHEAAIAMEEFGVAFGKAAAPEAFAVISGAATVIEHMTADFQALPGPVQSLIASFAIGVPMFVAAGTAWKFLSEVVIAGGATFRGLSAASSAARPRRCRRSWAPRSSRSASRRRTPSPWSSRARLRLRPRRASAG